jgi:hypothetical protein
LRIGGDQALLDRPCAHCLGIDAASIVADFDQDTAACMPRRQVKGCCGSLPSRTPQFRRFDPMIHAVAYQVQKRIAQLLDHSLVQFRLGAVDGELDSLAQIAGQVMDQAPKLLERGADRHHADVHRVLA